MLMQADNADFVLFRQCYQLINICVVNTELAFRPACDHFVCFPSAEIGIEPNKNLFVSQLVLKSPQSLKCPDIQHNAFFQGIIQLLLTNKILSIKNLMRFIATV